ncbi:MAG TPA: molybdopterin-dependent oxidoreductase [Ignavibacteria bacterium]
MDKLNIILNGKIVEGIKGESILQIAKRNKIKIPTLCNDDRLEPFSSCYLCVVEVEGMRGLQPSCSTKIAEGMKIVTENDKIRASRKSALELLLSNHYADCTAPCKQTCPAGVDVQGYISLINKGLYSDAVGLIKQTNPLPAICGRVCVRPCETSCRRNLVEGLGIGIDYLKRYATDKDFASEDMYKPETEPNTGKKVAIIGAGPGGLSAGYYLSLKGHEVEIFESSPDPGGMLRYGIPPYRLPNDIIDKEVKSIKDLGVKIHYGKKLGENLNYAKLSKSFDSLILAIGSQSGTNIGCENDNAKNVLSGIDFLRTMELTGKKYDFKGKKVAVIGGGNTAMDCCRSSIRCGAEKVYIIYRRTEKEMPANPIEIHESKLEGVEYMFLTAPAKVNIDDKGKLKTLTCFKMQLGEPDSSGRRRPLKVDGSEFDIQLDFILAAIGQKTEVNFIDDINNNSETKLILNKWGDIEADNKTLMTSINNIFAAGDAVTGPATLIQAIAQGKKAAISCHQFLTGKAVSGENFEFISKKDNFEKQIKDDYEGNYVKQDRQEMPTLDPSLRRNFDEVELGYSDNSAYQETLRCLECGCSEYYVCDLKKYSTEYNVEQKRYGGEYKKYEVNFAHPFIEIDNNKCILCSRCIRICKEVVNANALGLINRGFETFVAPSLNKYLQDTDCESCGLCISTCPTGAITENVKFKSGPVELESIDTICNYCSVGCEITLNHKSGVFMKVVGKNGFINKETNICRFPKFGYDYLNDKNRITKPLLKVKGKFEEISFEKAYDTIHNKIKSVEPDENAFFAGARLSNEELYLVQKFARAAAKTNNISSFHYLGRGDTYRENYKDNVPFEDIINSEKIYLLGSEINYENPVVGYIVNNARINNNTKLEVITNNENSSLLKRADRMILIKSYYYFIKSVNHYLLTNNLENKIYLDDNVTGFDEYKKSLLTENFNDLIKKSGVFFEKRLIDFANDYNNTIHALIIFAEKNLSSETCKELFNLSLITGKLGKKSSGLISLKEKNNSQGLFDMGISPDITVGAKKISNGEIYERLKKTWHVDELPVTVNENQLILLEQNKIRNLFIFGEDPVGCAYDKEYIKSIIKKPVFKVVQDYFLTETAEMADLILPSSFPFETGGTYSNTQKYVVAFEQQYDTKLEKKTYEQLIDLMSKFGVKNRVDLTNNISIEISSLLYDKNDTTHIKRHIVNTNGENKNKIFDFGCDIIVKRFEEMFQNSFK